MEIYKFKTMTGVNREALYAAFQKLLYNEQMKHPSFDYDEYEWVIGCDVFARLRQTIDWYSYSASDEIDKYLGIDLKVFSPGVMSTAISLSKKKRHLIFKEWLPKYKVPEEQLLEKTDDSTDVARSFDILTANEFAELVNVSLATVISSCEIGLYPGARKIMGEWLIPCFKTSEV